MTNFDREALASSLLSLYKTVLRMKGDTATTLYIPPESGWSFDSADEQYLLTAKSHAVIDLLRHLPYCNTHIAHSTDAISYVGSSWYSVFSASNPWPGDPEDADVQSHELPLTMQHENVGEVVIVDVETGMAKVWGGKWLDSTPECPVHWPKGVEVGRCPMLCRHRRGVPQRLATEVFEEWRRKFERLVWMFDARGEVLYPGEGEDDDLDVSACEVASCELGQLRVVTLHRCHADNLYRSRGRR